MRARVFFLMAIVMFSTTALAAAHAEPTEFVGENRFFVGPMFSLIVGTVAFGPTLELSFGLSKSIPLYFGIGTGVQFWPVLSSLLFMIPMVATVRYEFGTGGVAFPYLGADIGANIIAGPGGALALFKGMFRPGLRIQNFFFETKLGYSVTTFVFEPTLGVALPI